MLVHDWLLGSKHGFCAATDDGDPGDCAYGDRGWFGLPPEARTWEAAISSCMERCTPCHRCQFISLSIKLRDCSWYHTCSTPVANTDFRSGLGKANGTSRQAMEDQHDDAKLQQELRVSADLLRAGEGARGFQRTTAASCAPSVSVSLSGPEHGSWTARRCKRACAERPACTAAQFDRSANSSGRCDLYRQCLHRQPMPGVVVFHRLGPAWPADPSFIRWRTTAALVVASYSGRLSWLGRLCAAEPELSLVLYQKVNDGGGGGGGHGPDAAARLRQARTAACASGECGRLAYFATLPNFGLVANGAMRGGSREPYAYLSFLVDFYNNMPSLVIFAQDDCWRSWTCAVYNGPRATLRRIVERDGSRLLDPSSSAVTRHSSTARSSPGPMRRAHRLRVQAAATAAGGLDGSASRRATSRPWLLPTPRREVPLVRPDSQGCLCTLREELYKQTEQGTFEAALWPAMRFFWRAFFNRTVDDDVGQKYRGSTLSHGPYMGLTRQTLQRAALSPLVSLTALIDLRVVV